MKTVLFSVPLGYFARNLLRTGVLERLLASDQIRVVLVSPAHRDPAFVSEFAVDPRVSFEPQPAVRTDLNLWERAFWKLAVETWRRPALARIHMGLLRQYDRWYSKFYRGAYRPLLERVRPDLVITATPGNIAQTESPLIHEAQALGIRTLCLVFSWDNLAGMKGVLPSRPDHLGVWNELQAQEAIQSHHYHPEQITVLGPPHFDLYQDPRTFDSREDFCRRLGLDPSKKIVTLIIASMSASENTYILDFMLKAKADGRLPADAQLVCRLHPRVRPEKNRAAYAAYFNRPDIVIDLPENYLSSIKWNPTRPEMRALANLLKHTDVMVNIASTVTIEAAICDRPVVNLGFSHSMPEQFRKVIIESSWQYHYRYVRDRKCTVFAMNEEETISAIRMYLVDPSVHRTERRRLAEDLCYRLDGRATERTATLILRVLGLGVREIPASLPAASALQTTTIER